MSIKAAMGDMIAVMQHYAKGGAVQWRDARYPTAKLNTWEDFARGDWPTWNWEEYDYRIKPAPRSARTRYLVDNGLCETPFESLREAETMAAICQGTVTEYLEVV